MRALCLILLQCMLATEALPDKPETPKNESFATTPEARDKETCVDDEDHQVRQGGDSSTPNSGKSRKAHRRSRTRDPGRDASQKGKSTRRQSDSAAVASPSSNSLNGHQSSEASKAEPQVSNGTQQQLMCRARNPFNEWLVVTFHFESAYVPRSNCNILVMSTHAVPCRATIGPWARLLPDNSSVSQVLIPHRHGQVRNIQLQSSCVQRVQDSPLDSTWPIEPSWSCKPMTFESPLSLHDGRGNISLAVDSKPVFSAEFRVHGDETTWKHMAVYDADSAMHST